MRYFLDTEYNGWGGALISIALVPDDGEEFYAVIDPIDRAEPWVERNVLPYLDMVPPGLQGPRLTRDEAATALADFLSADHECEIVADWPEDIAQLAMLLVIGPGRMVAVPRLRFTLATLIGFSTAANSAVPHNALHDARSLRDYVLGGE